MRIAVATTGMAGQFAKVPLTNAALMREVGDLGLSMIRTRTKAGTDLDGVAFAPLSEGYAKVKREALGSDKVDLTVSGRMLTDMTQLGVTDKTVTLGFIGGTVGTSRASGSTLIQRSRSIPGADKANWHQNEGAGKSKIKRKFFGLNAGEQETIRQRVLAYWSRTLRG